MTNSSEPCLVLASGSPRRRELLADAGVEFEVIPADTPEETRAGEAPHELALRLAGEKAMAVAERLGPAPPRWVLGADTIVVHRGDVLGKPDDPEHAVALLTRLLGSRHTVITAFALVHSGELLLRARYVESEVEMRAGEEAEIRSYVATGEPLDKAGAYALQGEGKRFVIEVRGSRSNVIGLPVEETLAELAAARTELAARAESKEARDSIGTPS